MSAQNGQRARFQINRKRRVVQRMHLRAVMLALKDHKAAAASEKTATTPSATPRRGRAGPALAGN